MADIVAIETLRLRALALRSSIHNEHQLSAVELAGMNAKKTNEIIEVVNELCEIVDTVKTEQLALNLKYDSATENLNIDVGGN